MANPIQWETHAGEPIQAAGQTLTLFAQVLRIQLPFMRGGLVWNRPVSVLSKTSEGEEHVWRITDVTRQMQLAMLGASLGFALVLGLLRRKKREKPAVEEVEHD